MSAREDSSIAISTSGAPIRVTLDNFVRAETDRYFARAVRRGALGELSHRRAMTAIEEQDVVRMNRDTIYSSGVFDLDAASLAITLPDARGRFLSMQVVSEDHFTIEVVYDPGRFQYTKERVGTRYVFVIVFWSVSVYNAKGFFEKNSRDAYSLNSLTAKPDVDGSFRIQFGGCSGSKPNCLPIVPGWNYVLRLYRPRAEFQSGAWTLPEVRPVAETGVASIRGTPRE